MGVPSNDTLNGNALNAVSFPTTESGSAIVEMTGEARGYGSFSVYLGRGVSSTQDCVVTLSTAIANVHWGLYADAQDAYVTYSSDILSAWAPVGGTDATTEASASLVLSRGVAATQGCTVSNTADNRVYRRFTASQPATISSVSSYVKHVTRSGTQNLLAASSAIQVQAYGLPVIPLNCVISSSAVGGVITTIGGSQDCEVTSSAILTDVNASARTDRRTMRVPTENRTMRV